MSKKGNNTIIKILVVLFLIFFISVSGYEYIQYGSIFNNTEKYRKVYLEALELKNNEDYSAAFSKLENISPRYEAYDAVLFQQAQCAAKVGDEASVQKRLKSLINKYPQSYLYISAKYDLAKSYLRSSNNDEASKTFQNIINSHKNTDFETGSYYYLAEMNTKKDKNLSVKYWKKYIAQSQDGRFSLDCANNIVSAKAELAPEDKYNIALVYLNSQKYDEAIKYFNDSKKEKSWLYLAKAYIGKKNYQQAKSFIKSGLTSYASQFNKEDIANIIYAYADISSNKHDAWKELAGITEKKNNFADLTLYNLAKFSTKDEAENIYVKIVNNYFKGDYASEALQKLFWLSYKVKNYKLAKDYAQRHVNSFSTTKSAPQMHYWLGKIYEQEKDITSAIKVYNKILTKYPDDYYAMRAFDRISYFEKGKDYGWDINPKGEINQNNFTLELPYTYSEIKTKFGATLAELLLVEDFNTIEYFHDFNEPFIESWIAYKKGLKSTATTTARNAMDEYKDKPIRTDKKWEFVYPCYFIEEINKYATRNKISPYLLIALIREESYFNPLALSASRAVGLTQILPSTAREVSERKGYGNINEFLLFNPETNIKFGAAYFAQIKKSHDNNNVYAVASYNGGAGAVSSWRKNSYADMDEFIENIPYEETKTYVKKVFRSYWNYVRIYGE